MSRFEKGRRVSLGFRVGRISRLNACLLERKVAALGLCFGQIPYILSTVEYGEQTQDEIAAQLQVNRAATARTLKNMEEAGLVTREENPENRRQKLVRPTERSEALVNGLQDILKEHNDVLLAGFSAEEKAQLLNLLDRVIENGETMLKEERECHVQIR